MIAEHNRKDGAGQLFVVATPIGNLGDITMRALEILRFVDLIAAEDTRHSRRLLQHYGITTPTCAYHEHNERAASRTILSRLDHGLNVALISDAGTPLISDPGYRLLTLLNREGIKVIPIPGPCSIIAALSSSGLPTDRFSYHGFLPRGGRSREDILKEIGNARITQILMESPKRLLNTLNCLRPCCPPPRMICVAREITKLHEEFVHGDIDQLISRFSASKPLGEIILLIAPACGDGDKITDDEILTALDTESMPELTPSARAREIAKRLGVSRTRVYQLRIKHPMES